MTGLWDYTGEGYGSLSVRAPEGDLELSITSTLHLSTVGARCYGRTTLTEGESTFVALSWGDNRAARPKKGPIVTSSSTVAFWRDWLATWVLPDHPWRPFIERSALTLKGLSYAPTGAIMAASTTSLPETPGGTRNYDYRYTWIRDTGFALRALYRLGFHWEALEYYAFVLECISPAEQGDPFDLQIMYGIGGEKDLTEQTIDHLSGYGGAKPVRIGNGAWDEHQNDVWGMLLDGVDTQMRLGPPRSSLPPGKASPVWLKTLSLTVVMLTRASGRSEERRSTSPHRPSSVGWQPDAVRTSPAKRRPRALSTMERGADQIKEEILTKGVDERGRFRQAYENDALDASLLLIPLMGFLPPDDPRVREDHARHRRRAHRRRLGAPLQGGPHR